MTHGLIVDESLNRRQLAPRGAVGLANGFRLLIETYLASHNHSKMFKPTFRLLQQMGTNQTDLGVWVKETR